MQLMLVMAGQAEMAWIALSDRRGGRFNPAGLEGRPGDISSPPAPLCSALMRGTILLETAHISDHGSQTLFQIPRSGRDHGGFALKMQPQEGMFRVETGPATPAPEALYHEPDNHLPGLRISYSWDSRADWARLCVEEPGSDLVRSLDLPAPDPFSLAQVKSAIETPGRTHMHPDVTFVAISNRPEPVGPMPGLTGIVPVATDRGWVNIDKLRRGDLVITPEGIQVPVLRTVRRSVPACGWFRPIRIRAPFFNLAHDIVVAPQQRLVMGGSEVEYLFGREAVLAPVQHLLNGTSVAPATGPETVTYHQVLLPDHHAILAAGAATESLYVGRLRRNPDRLAQSVLSDAQRSRLPEHAGPLYPVLKPFEVNALSLHHAA